MATVAQPMGSWQNEGSLCTFRPSPELVKWALREDRTAEPGTSLHAPRCQEGDPPHVKEKEEWIDRLLAEMAKEDAFAKRCVPAASVEVVASGNSSEEDFPECEDLYRVQKKPKAEVKDEEVLADSD